MLFGILAAAPSDCKLQVYGHGLDGAAQLRASNAKRKDYLNAQLKCSDCKTYKSLSHFLAGDKAKKLTADEFAVIMKKSMRGLMRCLPCAKKRKDALDRAMGRTVEMIKYGISAPTVKVLSGLWRMNQFVSPERVKERNRILARQNRMMKDAVLAAYNKSL